MRDREGRTMRWGLLAVAAVMISGFAGSAGAASREENWARCKDPTPAVAIVGCAALIKEGKENQADTALARYNRGAAYAAKGQYDPAIKDLDEAIQLYPKYAHAFNMRGYAWW